MTLPFVIDNQTAHMADVLRGLLAETAGKPFDAATAYFNLGGYRELQEPLHQVGAFRLLLGAEPTTANDLGLRPKVQTDLEGEPYDEATIRLVESLIAFLREAKVQVRLYSRGFLHAKAYLFHQDRIGPHNPADRMRPYAAIVGSSNFTGPGLTRNKELNLVHRVLLPSDAAVDIDAAESIGYLAHDRRRETLLDPSGSDVSADARRFIKSEVGARAVADLTAWYERNWADAEDFKEDLIELLDASKFGTKEYTPYEVYCKALYEYFQDELGEDAVALGRSAVELAEFQEDSVRKARRILARYDGVLIADSVGLGKTWIGKKLLEDYAYHRRQQALVICPASLRNMWTRELAAATIAGQVLGMEEMGREQFDSLPYGEADVILIDESHNFRNDKARRYQALEEIIQRNGGRGRGGERKKMILLSATPINNDLYDLSNQIRLFTQNQADYFREAGIGDFNAYFRRARKLARQEDSSAGIALFNLLEEVMVRNTRPYIQAAYPNATIQGKPVAFPERTLHTVRYDLDSAYRGIYDEVVAAIESLTLAPYMLEAYRKKTAIRDEQEHEWEAGREMALVGIFKTRFLKRLESSIEAFRLSVARALTFEETYRDYLLDGKAVSSRDFQKAMRYLARDDEDELSAGSLADELNAVAEAKAYIESLPTVNLNEYELRKLNGDVESDIALLKRLLERTRSIGTEDGKLARLRELLAGELRGRKVLVFSSFKDTTRYLHKRLNEDAEWLRLAGNPNIRRIDSGNHPDERGNILWQFAPFGSGRSDPPTHPIDVLVTTDVLSEGQNLQDCGALVNYDLTWNPIRLVQRNGRIDRIGSPHARIGIYNLFPEDALEQLLHLLEKLNDRITAIDDLGLLDSSVLGELVHPRTFNTLRRLWDEDGAVLDEEEARAELAGPEMLLKQLKEVLNREGDQRLANMPLGIHSGLRRNKCRGMFFYFRAPRSDGTGQRHFWRYIDAATHAVKDNRFEIARIIACLADEPRFIDDQNVFAMMEKVIAGIVAEEETLAARAATPPAVEGIQQTVAHEMKGAMRRGKADRNRAKACLAFLGQPMGRALHTKLKAAYQSWKESNDDTAIVEAVFALAEEFGKERKPAGNVRRITRDDLKMVCFEYVSG